MYIHKIVLLQYVRKSLTLLAYIACVILDLLWRTFSASAMCINDKELSDPDTHTS